MAKRKPKTLPATSPLAPPVKSGEVIPFRSPFPQNVTLDEKIRVINRAHAQHGLQAIIIGHMIIDLEKDFAKAARGGAWKSKLNMADRTIQQYMQIGKLFPHVPALPEEKLLSLSNDELISLGTQAQEEGKDAGEWLLEAMLYKRAVKQLASAMSKKVAAAKKVVKAKGKAAAPAKASTKVKRGAAVEDAEADLEDADEDVERAEAEVAKVRAKLKAKPAALISRQWSVPKTDEQAYALLGLKVQNESLFVAPYAAFALGLTSAPGSYVKMEKTARAKFIALLTALHKKEGAQKDTQDKREAARAYFAGE